jgi:hypothetical protein
VPERAQEFPSAPRYMESLAVLGAGNGSLGIGEQPGVNNEGPDSKILGGKP